MRQLVQDLRSGRVDVIDAPDPRPGEGQVLVKTAYSLISPGTEQAVMDTASKGWIGKARDRPDDVRRVLEKVRADGVTAAVAAVRARLDDPLTPGYSSAGIVEAVGRRCAGLVVGDRVACVGRNAGVHADRTVVPQPLCVRVPDDLDLRYAAFGAVGAVAAHGVRLARVEAGSTVVVIGLGLVGQLAAQLATAAGARVVAVDLSEERIELARRLGAVGGVRSTENVRELVDAHSDGAGADAVLITAATESAQPIELAAAVARDRGSVSVVGDVALPVPRRAFYDKELSLVVSRSYGPGRYDPSYEELGHEYPIGYVRWTMRRLVRYFLEEVAAGRVRLDDLITHEFPIDQGSDAYAALEDPSRLAILLRYDDAAPARTRVPLRASAPPKAGSRRVALIGPGAFARSTLLPALRKLDDVEIAAVVGTSPARARATAERAGAEYAASDISDVLEDESIGTLVIATRHDSHAELACAALAAGKAVFLEKPLAIDDAQLAALVPPLEAGGSLVVDFNRGLAPATRATVEHFGARTEPIAVTYRVNAGYVEPDSWLRDPAVGGGRLVGEGCHFVDWCSALVGARLETIAAVPLGAGPRTLAGDNFLLTLAYADGSTASITYVASASRALPKERIEVLGAGRAAVLDDFRRTELAGPSGRSRRLRARRDKGHAALLAAALEFFAEGGEPPIPYERLIETTRATFVARDALAAGDQSPQPVRG